MNRDAEIERAARAIVAVMLDDPPHEDDWDRWIPEATVAITPLLDRIEALEIALAIYPEARGLLLKHNEPTP